MSGKKNRENYKHASWNKNGARGEAFVYERHIGGDGVDGVHGNFQSSGMKVCYPKDHKKEALNDFQLQDTVTG